MKESEKITTQANQEENDLKALGLYTKAMREERMERFQEHFVPRLKEKLGDKFWQTDQYSYGFYWKIGECEYTFTFYPKANRLLLHQSNKWIKPGLGWIVKNILK